MHFLELPVDLAGAELGDLFDKAAGGSARDHRNASEAEIHQRQADEQHDGDEHRDDRCPKADLKSTSSCRRSFLHQESVIAASLNIFG
jgi:hypothetical protein